MFPMYENILQLEEESEQEAEGVRERSRLEREVESMVQIPLTSP